MPGTYAYRGLTRKNDQVLITNADELYAQLPMATRKCEEDCHGWEIDESCIIYSVLNGERTGVWLARPAPIE